MELDAEFRSRFVEVIDGRDFVRYEGLRHLAHGRIRRVETELLQAPAPSNGHTAIVRAVVEDTDGRIWVGIGDAGPENCAAEVAPHRIRVAETRAKGRALRDMLDLDMVMLEEVYPKNGGSVALADPEGPMTDDQQRRIRFLLEKFNLTRDEGLRILRESTGRDSTRELTASEADRFITALLDYVARSRNAGAQASA